MRPTDLILWAAVLASLALAAVAIVSVFRVDRRAGSLLVLLVVSLVVFSLLRSQGF